LGGGVRGAAGAGAVGSVRVSVRGAYKPAVPYFFRASDRSDRPGAVPVKGCRG